MAINVFDGISMATESLSNELNGRLVGQSVWRNLIPRAIYPQNTGLEQTTYRQGNIQPTDLVPWEAETVAENINQSGSCDAPGNTVSWGFDQLVYAPEKTQFAGPILCKEQFTYEHIPDKFLEGYLGRLSMFSERVTEWRLQEHYISNSTSYIAGANLTTVGQTLPPGQLQATLPNVYPTSGLTQQMLDQFANTLGEQGAASQSDPTQYGYFNWGPNGPLYTLYIGQIASNAILRNDTFNTQVLNFSDMGKGEEALLRYRLGAAKQYYNYKHLINPYPPRYNWNGSQLVRVPVFINIQGTGQGVVSILNPAWNSAQIEAAFILHPLVMTAHIIEPEVNPAGLPFDPIDYHGEWKFVIGAYKLGLGADPLDRFGQHYAVFKHAIEPINTDYGYTILFNRCPGNAPLTVKCS
jgi:hypothetical protein